MASMRLLFVLLITLALSITCCLGAFSPRPIRHYVNGRQGWVLHPFQDYNQWAGSNRFLVHDTLLFRYNKEQDSVLEVSKEDYDSCNTEHPMEKKQDGESEFDLKQPGPYYFISGNKTHCQQGQKLIVQVLHYPSSLPSPPASSPASGSHHPKPVTPSPPAATSPSSSATPGTAGPATSPSSSTTPGTSGPATSPSSGTTPGTGGPATSPSSSTTPGTAGPATSPSSGTTPGTGGPATSPSSGTTPGTGGPATSPSSGTTPGTSGPATSPSSGTTPGTGGPATSPSSGTTPGTSGPATSPSSGTTPGTGGPATSPTAAGPGASAPGAAAGPGAAAPGVAAGPGSGEPAADVTSPAPSATKQNSAAKRGKGFSMGVGVLGVLVSLIMWLN